MRRFTPRSKRRGGRRGRDGNKRAYDLIERLHPRALLEARIPEDEAMKHRVLSRSRGHGLLGDAGSAELWIGAGGAVVRKRAIAKLVDEATLLPVTVEGLRGRRYVLTREKKVLARARDVDARAPEVTFVAPLDPFVWDRRLLRDLFAFDYTWEVYTPEPQRVHGYYVLPMLFGDGLVGRIEPRFERRTRTLRVVGAWLEDGFALDTPGFFAAFARALGAYAAFVGAERVTFARTRTARALARAYAAHEPA